MPLTIDLILLPTDNNNRLDKLLVIALESEVLSEHGLSRARLQSLIKDGFLSLQGEIITDPAYKVKNEIACILHVPLPQETEIAAVPMDLAVIYEDEDLLVVDKPSGLTTHPGAGNYSNTLVNGLLHYFKEGSLSGIGGVLRPGIVHRLDKETSGLLVVAKNDAAHQHLAAQFAEHVITRRYKALVKGVPKPLSGVINKALIRHRIDRKKFTTTQKGGKEAITHYKVCEIFSNKLAWVECRLETGRTHQIRVHLSDFGHGLVGDKLYGATNKGRYGERIASFPRQALHAETLGFIHPKTQEKLEFKANLPLDLSHLLDACRKMSE